MAVSEIVLACLLPPHSFTFLKLKNFNPRGFGMPRVFIAKCLRIWLGFLLQLPFAVQFNDPECLSLRKGMTTWAVFMLIAELGTGDNCRYNLILLEVK